MSGRFGYAAALATAVVLGGAGAAIAQSAGQQCVQQGFKPGTAGYYHCLQSNAASESGESQSPGTGEPGSILSGDPDSAVTEYSGSPMEGATTPDPEILKQLNSGRPPVR